MYITSHRHNHGTNWNINILLIFSGSKVTKLHGTIKYNVLNIHNASYIIFLSLKLINIEFSELSMCDPMSVNMFFWIEGTLYEIATQIYCQDKILELFWQHWKCEITQISIRQEDNLQCNLSVKVYLLCKVWQNIPILCILMIND